MTITNAALWLNNPAPAGPMHLYPLTLPNISKMMCLQSIVLDELAEDKKSFIIRQTRRQFKAALKPPHISLGVFDPSGRLIGQALLAVCRNGDPGNHLTASPAASMLARLHMDFGVVHSVLVDPGFRRHGIMIKLLEAQEVAARSLGLRALLGEVALGNLPSEKGFRHRQFACGGEGIDPSDNTKLNYWHKPLQIGVCCPGVS